MDKYGLLSLFRSGSRNVPGVFAGGPFYVRVLPTPSIRIPERRTFVVFLNRSTNTIRVGYRLTIRQNVHAIASVNTRVPYRRIVAIVIDALRTIFRDSVIVVERTIVKLKAVAYCTRRTRADVLRLSKKKKLELKTSSEN